MSSCRINKLESPRTHREPKGSEHEVQEESERGEVVRMDPNFQTCRDRRASAKAITLSFEHREVPSRIPLSPRSADGWCRLRAEHA